MTQLRLLPLATLLLTTPLAAQTTLPALTADLARVDAMENVPDATVRSIAFNLDIARRIEGDFSAQAREYRERTRRYLDRALAGEDPFLPERGDIVNRGYPSDLSLEPQGYSIYTPPDYDPSRSYPLLIVLHGGSSNGNLFLGVVLGNNMSWEHYNEYLWDDFDPQTRPPFIVAAPDGFGQVMWRWMGERDVLSVIADIQANYNVDADRIMLMGLSNGGVGAYSIGSRHAWRFSVVQAVAGAPSWLLYAGGPQLPEERLTMRAWSAAFLPWNTTNTDFRFYHGTTDTGPMRPPFVREFEGVLEGIGLSPQVTWYDAGHDILYRVHRHGARFPELADRVRNRRPATVHLQTGDYRAARQHWVTVTRLESLPEIGEVHASIEGATMTVRTSKVLAFSLDLRDAPIEGANARIVIDESTAYEGPVANLGHVVNVRKTDAGWSLGYPDEPEGTLVKRAGVSGPITDAYFDRMVHVYGSRDPEHTEGLRRAAERGSKGWPLWLWRVRQEVIADTEVTPALARSAHLVLYGTEGDNAVLERIAGDLPIRVAADAIEVGDRRFEGEDIGVRFIYPNPEAPSKYVIVQGGVTTAAVDAGNSLHDFLPDYFVYDRSVARTRSRLVSGRNRPVALGYFDRFWRLPSSRDAEGADDSSGSSKQLDEAPTLDPEEPSLPVPPAPRTPPRTRMFLAPPEDPAGRVAREIASLVPTFHNYRAEIPGASWRVDRASVWQIRPESECHAALEAAGIVFRPVGVYPTPVPSPVELLGPIDGVWFRISHEDRPMVVSCELAARLPALVAILKEHEVRGVEVMSAYRETPRPSFHTMGLALDIGRVWTDGGWLNVLTDFEETPMSETCAASPATARARRMLRITCSLWRSRILSSVLTPNYNDGHRNHWHIDVRPDDPRLFLR
jgi:hypothetical protein